MATDFTPFPDIEEVIRELVLADFDFESVTDEIPENLGDNLPALVLTSLGGQRLPLNDYPVVDLEVFAATKAQAKSLSEALDAYLLGYPRSVDVGDRRVTLDGVQTTTSPHSLPWEDRNIRRFASTYTFSVRR